MKRKILALFLFMLWLFVYTAPANAAYAHVACSGTCNVNVINNATVLLPSSGTLTFTIHDLLVLAIRVGGSATISSVVSSPVETWTCGAQIESQAGASRISVCRANNIAGGSYTITVTISSSTTNSWATVDEFSGNPTGCDPIDVAQVSGISGGTNSSTSLSASLTSNDTDLLYAATGAGANISGFTGPTPTIFGSGATVSLNSASPGRAVAIYTTLAASSGTATLHWTSGSTDWAIIFVGFRSTCLAANPHNIPMVLDMMPNLLPKFFQQFFIWHENKMKH